MSRRRSSTLALWLASVAGLAAFCWPLLLAPPRAGGAAAHVTDAPVLVALLVPLVVAAAIAEGRGYASDARYVALLGALAAASALLRIPKGPSGEGFVFLLPILAGWALGARFAFLLGAFSMLTSALVTGGIGPWLPFQMLGVAWVGAGAAAVRRATGGRWIVPALAAYAWGASLAYGLLLNLWFWPFLGRTGELFFRPGLGVGETLRRYLAFYAATSLPWDTGRALLSNVPAVAVLARPVAALLERAGSRLRAEVEISDSAPEPEGAGAGITGGPVAPDEVPGDVVAVSPGPVPRIPRSRGGG